MSQILIKSSNGHNCYVDSLPTKCPFCHNKITPNLISLRILGENAHLFFECPDHKDCKQTFIGYYETKDKTHFYYNNYTSSGTILGRNFSDSIIEISNLFEKIYNQALAAEQQQLFEICGVGYRKALEFLIKDYSIKNHPTERENIEKLLLGQCIQKYISDANIKSVSKRAVWLGNDETHYIRKWEGKNLSDLKKLIDLTIHWIEAEVLTKSFEDEMPE